jgi:hypothetical protein
MKKRYIYVVTRCCENEQWGRSIPNLGVCTSKKKANAHFNMLVRNRRKNGYTINLIQSHDYDSRVATHRPVIREAYITRKYMVAMTKGYIEKTEIEHLKIERWTIEGR